MNETNKYHQSTQQISNDEVFVEAAKTDMKLFAPLYDKYYIPLFRFIYQRVDNKDEVVDITAQVFLNAMKNINKYISKGLPFSSWLFRIAINEINLFYRKQKAERNYYISISAQQDLYDETLAFCHEKADIQKFALNKLLKNLNEEELSLIEMKYAEKRSLAEMVQITGFSESNTKVKLHRIMKKIRKYAGTPKMVEVMSFITFCSMIMMFF